MPKKRNRQDLTTINLTAIKKLISLSERRTTAKLKREVAALRKEIGFKTGVV